jgi:hypothetical protein
MQTMLRCSIGGAAVADSTISTIAKTELSPWTEMPGRPPAIHGTPKDDGNEKRETRHSGVVNAVQELQRLGPGVEPGALAEGIHKGVYAGEEKVEAQRPVREVGEETER